MIMIGINISPNKKTIIANIMNPANNITGLNIIINKIVIIASNIQPPK